MTEVKIEIVATYLFPLSRSKARIWSTPKTYVRKNERLSGYRYNLDQLTVFSVNQAVLILSLQYYATLLFNMLLMFYHHVCNFFVKTLINIYTYWYTLFVSFFVIKLINIQPIIITGKLVLHTMYTLFVFVFTHLLHCFVAIWVDTRQQVKQAAMWIQYNNIIQTTNKPGMYVYIYNKMCDVVIQIIPEKIL